VPVFALPLAILLHFASLPKVGSQQSDGAKLDIVHALHPGVAVMRAQPNSPPGRGEGKSSLGEWPD
jgi:hypothetical protein